MSGITPVSWWATIPSPLPEEPPIDPNLISPGLLGLAAFVLLIIAVALLFRSMRHQLKKVDPNLPEAPPREPEIPIVDSPPNADAESGAQGPAPATAVEDSREKATGETADGGEPAARD